MTGPHRPRKPAPEPDRAGAHAEQRNGEWEGAVNLWFDPGSQQYLPEQDSQPIIWAGKCA